MSSQALNATMLSPCQLREQAEAGFRATRVPTQWCDTVLLPVQFAFNTLSRVSPVSHGVCNVVKRVAIIVTSVLFFGTPLSNKTKIGAPTLRHLSSLGTPCDLNAYPHIQFFAGSMSSAGSTKGARVKE